MVIRRHGNNSLVMVENLSPQTELVFDTTSLPLSAVVMTSIPLVV